MSDAGIVHHLMPTQTGLNGVAAGGILSTDVTGGLPAGSYRMSSINAAANHQPVLGAVAQHGTFDDWVYVSHYFPLVRGSFY